jgi:chloramphenicol O-acetyltransferase type A
MCVNVDITAFYPFVKRKGYSFTVSMVYAISRASNAIPEFRQRIRGEQVVEHEIVNPGFTILIDKDLFSFCIIEYTDDFLEFTVRAAENIAHVKAHPNLEVNPEKDNVLYMSPIPWVSFTSFSHPMQLHPADTVPRFAWGKYFKENDRLKIPLDVQGHHAVMDGIHMGNFYEKVQAYLDHPEAVPGQA